MITAIALLLVGQWGYGGMFHAAPAAPAPAPPAPSSGGESIKATLDALVRPVDVAPAEPAKLPARSVVTAPPSLNGMKANYRVLVDGRAWTVYGRKDEAGYVYWLRSENPHMPRPQPPVPMPQMPRAQPPPHHSSATRPGRCPVCGSGCPQISRCGNGRRCSCGAC
jgi:hypothetical protein